MSQAPGSRRRTPPDPIEVPLSQEKSTRQGMTLFRVADETTIPVRASFVILPGPKGQGWMLKIFPDAD